MSKNEFRQSGDYKLEYLRLVSYSGTQAEITNIIDEVNIFEDLFSSSMSGDVRINDANNLIKNLPIVGQELLEMGYRTKGVEGVVELSFFVYKIGEREKVNEKTQAYSLYFTSEEAITNSSVQVSKALEGTIGEMVSTLMDEVKTTKPIRIEETVGLDNFIIPMWSPFQAITWLSAKAIGNDDQSDFIFYETAFGYRFDSVTTLAKQKPFKTYYHQQTMNKEMRGDGEAILTSIVDYTIHPSFDTIKNMATGGYGSQTLMHDITTKTAIWNEYDYKKESKTSSIDKFSPLPSSIDFPTSGNIGMDFIQSNNRNSNNYNIRKRQERKSALALLTNCDISITVSGDSRMETGMVIDTVLPSKEPYESEAKQETFIGGNRLITSINHKFTKTKYFMHMRLAKNAVAEEIK